MTEENFPQLWTFTPSDDLTVDEFLAMLKHLAPLINIQLHRNDYYESMPANVKRHFSLQPHYGLVKKEV